MTYQSEEESPALNCRTNEPFLPLDVLLRHLNIVGLYGPLGYMTHPER